MRTIQEYDPTDYYFLLKSVIDSRLLFSTKKYIAEHIGYSSLTSKKSVILLLDHSWLKAFSMG